MNKKDCVLIIIDIQEKFRPAIKLDKIIPNVNKLIRSFEILKIPIIVTEQYPKGLGKTIREIELKEHKLVEKTSFDCFGEKKFSRSLKKKNLIICGIEAHVCVAQTVLTALSKGFNAYLVVDAVSSRKKQDYSIAIKRLEKEGAKLVSTEMIIFQMMKDSKDKNFKKISKIIKN